MGYESTEAAAIYVVILLNNKIINTIRNRFYNFTILYFFGFIYRSFHLHFAQTDCYYNPSPLFSNSANVASGFKRCDCRVILRW